MLEGSQQERLRALIAQAIALADDKQQHLVGALLAEALDTLERDRPAALD